MTPLLRRTVLSAVTLVVLYSGTGHAGGGLVLRLLDGTQVHADEVVTAGDEFVTVAAVGERARVERIIAWTDIAAATGDGRDYSTAELRFSLGLTDEVSASYVPPVLPPLPVPACGCGRTLPCPVCRPVVAFRPVGRVIGVRPDPISAYADIAPAVYPAGIPSSEVPFALGVLRERRRIEAINPFLVPTLPVLPAPPLPTGDAVPGDLSQIEARVTSIRGEGGSDISALGVELVGLDAAGRAMPVEGTAQLFLYAGEQKLVRAFDDVYAAKHKGLVRLAEWTRLVQPDASLVLRLPQPLPEHDPTVSPYGTLRVRLSMPGAGVFETIAEPVVLRAASPFRDALRSETGSRFLPDEKTTGSRLETWPRQKDLSSVD